MHDYGQSKALNECDVLSLKGVYCRRNSVILDQLFSHVCDSIYV